MHIIMIGLKLLVFQMQKHYGQIRKLWKEVLLNELLWNSKTVHVSDKQQEKDAYYFVLL